MKRRLLKYAGWAMLGAFVFMALINLSMLATSTSRIYTDIETVPKRNVAVLLGTDMIRPNGSTNVHFLNRINSAAMVYASGKANSLIITGSTNNKGFNEVLGMQKALLAKGVPARVILLDFDGKRTFNSARSARERTHLQSALIITDDFHAARSIFLFKHFGIDAIVFSSGKEPVDQWYIRHRIREFFARVKAVIDVMF